jgi:peroxiredoxin
MIAVGEKAPDFNLPDHLGRTVSLAKFVGKQHVVLLFYPLDWTPT